MNEGLTFVFSAIFRTPTAFRGGGKMGGVFGSASAASSSLVKGGGPADESKVSKISFNSVVDDDEEERSAWSRSSRSRQCG